VEHSLAQDHVAHITKAYQAVQDDNNGPGKTKASVDPPPPDLELQAHRSVTLNPDTIHADPDNVVAIGLQPNQGLQAHRSVTLNPDTIHADPDNVVAIGSHPNQEPNVEGGGTLNLATIHLGLEDLVTPPLQSNQELQPDSGWVLDLKTIHSELDHTVARALSTGLALNQKSLPPPIVLNTVETPATKYSDRDLLYDISPKISDPTSSELEDDDATGWKLVPLYGVALLFLVATVFSRLGILHVFQWRWVTPGSKMASISGEDNEADSGDKILLHPQISASVLKLNRLGQSARFSRKRSTRYRARGQRLADRTKHVPL
jgi:hypothetical protein